MALEIEKVIIAGHARQGVVFLGRVLAESGLIRDLEVTYLPAYGPIIMAGHTECTVILSTVEVGSPVVGIPDVLIALTPDAFFRLSSRLKAGGMLVFDTSSFEPKPRELRDDVRPIGVPTTELFEGAPSSILLSASLMGAYAAYSRLVDLETLLEALKRVGRAEGLPAGVTPIALRKAVESGASFMRDKGYMHTRYRYSIFKG